MQEVSELDVVTLLVRYKTLFKKQCVFLHVEREERVERRIQEIENNFRKCRKLKEKLKENTTERNTLTETSKGMER